MITHTSTIQKILEALDFVFTELESLSTDDTPQKHGPALHHAGVAASKERSSEGTHESTSTTLGPQLQ